jgi:hypothetical protein
MYCTVTCLCILCPSFAFLHLGLLCSLAIMPPLRSPARLRWRPSGKPRVHPSQSFLLSIPTVSCPFAGNHMSVVSESDLLHLVSIGVLPPKELCSWRICRGVTVPTEDTHESVIYIPFLIRGLALPISPFFRGLLDFYNLNLTHLNPNSILHVFVLFICVKLSLVFCHTSAYRSTCITIGLGWPGDSTSWWGARVWRCAVGGKPSTSTSHSRTASKDDA